MAAKIKKQTVLQFNDQEFNLDVVEANVKQDWKEKGNAVADIKTLAIYVKPEDAKAYYVVNDEFEAFVDL